MNTSTFWELIKKSKENSSDTAKQIEYLKDFLIRSDKQEVTDFSEIVRNQLFSVVNTYKLNLVLDLLLERNQLTNEIFDQFRTWLILQGKTVFNKIIDNPDLLSEHDINFDGESIAEIANNVFRNRYGTSISNYKPLDYSNIVDAPKNEEEEIDFLNKLHLTFPNLIHRMRVEELSWHPADDALLLSLKNNGSDLNEVRTIDHFFICKNKSDAAALTKELIKYGHVCKTFEEDDDVAVSTQEQSSPNEVTQRTENLRQLADSFNSVYDGWGTVE